MANIYTYELKYVKGIGPQRADLLLTELGIEYLWQLLHHFPSRYLDRSQYYAISQLSGDMPSVQIRGRFVAFAIQGEGAKRRLVAIFSDGHATMEVVWFQRIRQIQEAYRVGNEYVIFGKPTQFNGRWSMVHPEVDPIGTPGSSEGLRGVYPLTEKLRNRGITSRSFFQWINSALSKVGKIEDPLTPSIIERYRLMPYDTALRTVHNPRDAASLEKARFSLKFRELLLLQLNIRRYARRRSGAIAGFRFPRVGQYFNSFYSTQLQFPLTGAQKRVIKEIRSDMNTGRQMNRLLQGDVGSGKTLVALLSMLIALDNGYQACLMAPTEILATQHFETLSSLLAPIGVNVKLLTGSTRKKQRELIASQLLDGSLHILIGTHAVIEDNVVFSRLGYVVIDEQHRFGVMQRAKMWKKNSTPPHMLVMTATPIPRTLAMTVYGDLDVSVIDEMPPGRQPVTTLLRYDDRRYDVYRAIGRQLAAGHQAYIVYPLIEENEKLSLQSLMQGYDEIRETFPHYRVAYVHGKMKPAEKDHQMSLFASHEADILVATTVIEVGVNVPNATTMVIENAERFGLSQLHQLRGRVGRGGGQSYCVLMSKHQIAATTRKRLELMTSTTDGFQIAEADLKMRGPGDLEGTLQSGMALNLTIANLATDGQIVQLARDAADEILDSDPDLSAPPHQPLAQLIAIAFSRQIDLSQIS